jgi:hypothetical protein
LVFFKDFFPIVAVFCNALIQIGAIFEGAIHSLPEEGNDRVGGVSQQSNQGSHLIVTIAPVGFVKKSSTIAGIKGTASGNCF